MFFNRKQNGYHKRRGSSAKFRPYPEPFSLKILIRNFCVCTLARRQRGHQPLFSGFYRRPRTSSPSSHPGSSAIYVYVAVWHSQIQSSVPWQILVLPVQNFFQHHLHQCCESGSELDPYSVTLLIWIHTIKNGEKTTLSHLKKNFMYRKCDKAKVVSYYCLSRL